MGEEEGLCEHRQTSMSSVSLCIKEGWGDHACSLVFVPSPRQNGVLEGGAGRGVLATRVKVTHGFKRCWGGAAAIRLLRRLSGKEKNMSKINNNMLLTGWF